MNSQRNRPRPCIAQTVACVLVLCHIYAEEVQPPPFHQISDAAKADAIQEEALADVTWDDTPAGPTPSWRLGADAPGKIQLTPLSLAPINADDTADHVQPLSLDEEELSTETTKTAQSAPPPEVTPVSMWPGVFDSSLITDKKAASNQNSAVINRNNTKVTGESSIGNAGNSTGNSSSGFPDEDWIYIGVLVIICVLCAAAILFAICWRCNSWRCKDVATTIGPGQKTNSTCISDLALSPITMLCWLCMRDVVDDSEASIRQLNDQLAHLSYTPSCPSPSFTNMAEEALRKAMQAKDVERLHHIIADVTTQIQMGEISEPPSLKAAKNDLRLLQQNQWWRKEVCCVPSKDKAPEVDDGTLHC